MIEPGAAATGTNTRRVRSRLSPRSHLPARAAYGAPAWGRPPRGRGGGQGGKEAAPSSGRKGGSSLRKTVMAAPLVKSSRSSPFPDGADLVDGEEALAILRNALVRRRIATQDEDGSGGVLTATGGDVVAKVLLSLRKGHDVLGIGTVEAHADLLGVLPEAVELLDHFGRRLQAVEVLQRQLFAVEAEAVRRDLIKETVRLLGHVLVVLGDRGVERELPTVELRSREIVEAGREVVQHGLDAPVDGIRVFFLSLHDDPKL